MRFLLIFIVVVNIYSQDLKDRIEKLSIAPQPKTIQYIKYDPFKKGQDIVKKVMIKKVENKAFHITTVLNNRAFINSDWHRVGDIVNGYKIIQIRDYAVLVKKGGKVYKFGIKRRENIVKVEGK